MSADLAILVPVLGRPHRVEPTLQGFKSTAPGCRILFIADPDDEAEITALQAAGAAYIAPGGNYAEKIRAGVLETDHPFIFTGADDLEPLPRWLSAAVAVIQQEGVEVVGINDLIPRQRQHATHFLMLRDYAELPTIAGEPGPFYGGYSHWYCDDELIATAKKRGAYGYAQLAKVRHLHPFAGTASDDPIYEKGRELRRHDRRLFNRRRALWT
jgi:hypothetical protein